MHEHNSCEHNLEFCRVCDVVYCERCKSQWRKNTTYTYPTFTYNNDKVLCGHTGTAGDALNLTSREPTTAVISGFNGVYLEPVGSHKTDPFTAPEHTEGCCPTPEPAPVEEDTALFP